jgi:AcrR family transcriptional regulator
VSELVRPYKGVSAQERRGQRRERLIEAALDVIGSTGLAGLTMTAVCARARLTERYFYESFAERGELLEAVFDACMREMDAATFRALDAAPPDLLERCRAAAGAMVSVLTDDPRKARLYSEAVGSGVLRERRADANRAHADLLAAQIRELRSPGGALDDARLRLATLILIAGTAEAILSWLDGSLALSRETLIEQCAQLAVATADAVAATTAA